LDFESHFMILEEENDSNLKKKITKIKKIEKVIHIYYSQIVTKITHLNYLCNFYYIFNWVIEWLDYKKLQECEYILMKENNDVFSDN